MKIYLGFLPSDWFKRALSRLGAAEAVEMSSIYETNLKCRGQATTCLRILSLVLCNNNINITFSGIK